MDYFRKARPEPLGDGGLDDLPDWGRGGNASIPNGRGLESPADYVIEDDGLVAAVNASLILGRPLLVTGEPGTGKTALADAMAWQLGLTSPLLFATKSTSVARDLFYTFDALGRFRSGPEAQGNLEYISFQALGIAILLTGQGHPELLARMNLPKEIQAEVAAGTRKPRRSVVLIDEIDKAPRDFPNDLLNEIDRMQFSIPELGNRLVVSEGGLRPIVVITSNSERNLPEPFLRRCCYYHFQFPSPATLVRIVRNRTGIGRRTDNSAATAEMMPDSVAPEKPAPEPGDDIASRAVPVFNKIRDLNLHKKPATSELIDWVRLLIRFGIDLKGDAALAVSQLARTLSALAKTEDDLNEMKRSLPSLLK